MIEDPEWGYLPMYDPDLMTLFNPAQRELEAGGLLHWRCSGCQADSNPGRAKNLSRFPGLSPIELAAGPEVGVGRGDPNRALC